MRQAVIGCLLIGLAGCGSSPAPQPPADTAAVSVATPPATTVAAPSIVPMVTPALARQPRVRPVTFDRLMALMPEVEGWLRTDERGEQLTNPTVTARAEALYRRDTGHVELEITDSARDELLLAPLAVFLTSGYAERSDTGFRRATEIRGRPAFEEWHGGPRRGEVTVVVADRFIVRATGHDVDALAPVRRIVDAIDLSTLSALR